MSKAKSSTTGGSHGVPAGLDDLAAPRLVAKDAVVFHLGAPARHVFFLVRGRVALRRFASTGEEVAIHVAEAGEFFAEAALHAERYHCTAVALCASEVAAIASAALRARFCADPASGMAWLEAVSTQLRQARARVERLSIRGAAERVRHLLLTEGRGERPTVVLRGPVRELAVHLGLTHEALYRTLATMQKDGRLQRRGRELVLLR